MERKRLSEEFYQMHAPQAAPALLGKWLCRQKKDGNVCRYRITETECYYSEEDTACHANKGRTERTKVLYEQGGTAYVYLCYGIHHLFNVVTGEKDFPEAVLIRGVEGYNGPGKLTKAMEIDMTLNWANLITSDELWLEEDDFVPEYTCGKRIGIDYATPQYRDILWRFTVKKEEKDKK